MVDRVIVPSLNPTPSLLYQGGADIIMEYTVIPASSARIRWYPTRSTHILQPKLWLRCFSLSRELLRETLESMNRQVFSDIQELWGFYIDKGSGTTLCRDVKKVSYQDGFLGGRSGSHLCVARQHRRSIRVIPRRHPRTK